MTSKTLEAEEKLLGTTKLDEQLLGTKLDEQLSGTTKLELEVSNIKCVI